MARVTTQRRGSGGERSKRAAIMAAPGVDAVRVQGLSSACLPPGLAPDALRLSDDQL